MNPYQLDRQLKSMVGNSYQYNGNVYLIKSYKIVEKIIKVKTDKEDLTIFKDDAELLTTRFKQIDQKQESVMQQPNPYLPQTTTNIPASVISTKGADLVDILMNNIKKVQEDANYISKAAEINNQVKSIIDLAKTELEMYKVAAFMNK